MTGRYRRRWSKLAPAGCVVHANSPGELQACGRASGSSNPFLERHIVCHSYGRRQVITPSSEKCQGAFPKGSRDLGFRGHRSRQVKAKVQDEILVKVCGITHPEDAEIAVAAGADFLGVIQCPRFRRAVSSDTTKAIAAIAHRAGIPAVGVFVDEDAEAIARHSLQGDLDVVQLHGSVSRTALPLISQHLQVVYVANASKEGHLALPEDLTRPGQRWV